MEELLTFRVFVDHSLNLLYSRISRIISNSVLCDEILCWIIGIVGAALAPQSQHKGNDDPCLSGVVDAEKLKSSMFILVVVRKGIQPGKRCIKTLCQIIEKATTGLPGKMAVLVCLHACVSCE